MAESPLNLGVLMSPDDATGLSLGEGELRSAEGRSYPIRDGIAYLLSTELQNEKTKRKEKEGWEKVFKEHNWNPSGGDILGLPEGGDDPYWIKVTEAFRFARKAVEYHRARVGLDLACGLGWAAARFARDGASMIAADFNDTRYNGLAAAVTTWEHGVRFDAVCCDGERLPVKDGALDFVFICSALHHFTRPVEGLCEIHRTLKRGGVLIDICESFRTGLDDDAREAEHEQLVEFREAGINENSYLQSEYEEMFRAAGFDLLTLMPRFDQPAEGAHPRDWKWRGAKHAARTAVRPRWRSRVALACLPIALACLPFPALFEGARRRHLQRSIADRIFLAYK